MENNIGQYLNSLRNERNLTLEEISEKTKIKTRILQSIEAGQFDDLGGKGYAKALIVTYSKALGADETAVLKMFNESFTSIQVKYSKPLIDQPQKKYHFHMNLIYIFLLIVLIAVLTFFTVKFYREGKLSSPIFDIFNKKPKETTEVIPDTTETDTTEIEVPPELPLINDAALHDSTNYASDLIFEDKDSPFKFNE